MGNRSGGIQLFSCSGYYLVLNTSLCLPVVYMERVKLGLSFFSVETPTINVGGFTFGGGSASSSEFTFVVGAGYVVPVSPNIDLDFGAAFNVVSDLNHITGSVTANFGL
jgi:hypothetical protein